ncbi:hypothetical protein [Mycolicibacter minnesotensis]|uniref:hypothetical protein n=1 Tax=Mycolicibacter minnesotensis TaxID=1118379 RepID=UPI0039089E3D
MNAPVTAPWQVVGRLVDGPVLSKQGALIERRRRSTQMTNLEHAEGSHPGAQTVTVNAGGGR